MVWQRIADALGVPKQAAHRKHAKRVREKLEQEDAVPQPMSVDVSRGGDVRTRAYCLTVKVVGIDPGTAACGYGIVHRSDGRLRAIEHGSWSSTARERPEIRLRAIFDAVGEVIERHAPDAVALEESFVGADARTALSVGQARGAVLVACAGAGVECREYSPARVKQAVCGYGRAEKVQVQRMVARILALPSPPTPDHAADALAVAICHALAPPLLELAR